MIHAQSVKRDIIVQHGTAITNSATVTSLQVDLLGFNNCAIEVFAGTQAATTRWSTLRLTESDDTVLTNYTGITQFTGTSNTTIGTNGFIIPAARTATTRLPLAVFNVNTQYRKRYLTLEACSASASTITVVAMLSRAEQMPVVAADMNVDLVVNG